jgi:hypothetical protein
MLLATVYMNFITRLLMSTKGYNALLIIIDKFSKAIVLLIGCSN